MFWTKLVILIELYVSLGSYASCSVLYPIKEGTDAGIVFIPGAGPLWGYQYEALALQIQEMYPERLWIYLSNISLPEGDFSSGLYNDDNLNNTHIGRGKVALYEAGMPEDAPVYGTGHSAGGTIAYTEVEFTSVNELANGIILIGATMWTQAYEDYPVPVIAINGDLDGLMRVSQVALDYRYAYDKILAGDNDYVYRFPNVMIEGMNHAQYVTGEYTDVITIYWTEPEITNEQSMQLIAEAVSTFLVYELTTDDDMRSEAQTRLDNYNAEMMAFLPPIYQGFDAQATPDGATSPWAAQAQSILADLEPGQEDLVEVVNDIVSETGLVFRRPNISYDSPVYAVSTYTSLYYDGYVSATALHSKYKSSQAIKEAISGEDQDPKPSVECRDINQAAWDLYYSILPELSVNRYLNRNITVTFLEDLITETEEEWLDRNFWFLFNSTHLSIRAVTYLSETDETEQSGMHHCKLASPARIMEFFYTDALYEIAYLPTTKKNAEVKDALNFRRNT